MNRLLPLFVILMLVIAACGGSDETAPLGQGRATEPNPDREAAALLTPTPDVRPVQFPEDESTHDVLTEWWYYTGHMFTSDGTRYGFEYVFFRSERGAFPPAYVAHAAITDSAGERFVYDQRFGFRADQQPEVGLDLALDGWSMSAANGRDRLHASVDQYTFDLQLEATKPPVLHDGIGWFDFGEAGGSYYYSRTRMEIAGTLVIDGVEHEVTGLGWMDHQWGDFIVSASGGWDWFALQLDNDEELMVFSIRDADGEELLLFGTQILADGTARSLDADAIEIEATGSWTSPHTDVTYPSGWEIRIDSIALQLTLSPTLLEQELDTRETTGMIYWEGEVVVEGTLEGLPVSGLGYVELTGYAGGFAIAPASS